MSPAAAAAAGEASRPGVKVLAWPLRVRRDGRLARAVDAWDPVLEIIQAMAASPPGGWSDAPWFCLETLFLEVKRNVEDQPEVARALNDALARLGTGWARVDAVLLDVEGARNHPYRPLHFTLRLAGPHGLVHRSLSL